MLRGVGAILAGLAVFAGLEFVAVQLAIALWPAYALAAPTRDYTLEMLLVRLSAGALGCWASGAVAARVHRGARQAALMLGVTLLAGSVVWHIKIWEQYPVWYHLSWFACIVPFAVLGGRMASNPGAIAGHPAFSMGTDVAGTKATGTGEIAGD
jgi:hypothetical protein